MAILGWTRRNGDELSSADGTENTEMIFSGQTQRSISTRDVNNGIGDFVFDTDLNFVTDGDYDKGGMVFGMQGGAVNGYYLFYKVDWEGTHLKLVKDAVTGLAGSGAIVQSAFLYPGSPKAAHKSKVIITKVGSDYTVTLGSWGDNTWTDSTYPTGDIGYINNETWSVPNSKINFNSITGGTPVPTLRRRLMIIT